MKLVHAQIEIMRKLLDELDSKTDERSHWTIAPAERRKNRIDEAQAIVDSAHALVGIVKTAKPDYDRELSVCEEKKG